MEEDLAVHHYLRIAYVPQSDGKLAPRTMTLNSRSLCVKRISVLNRNEPLKDDIHQ